MADDKPNVFQVRLRNQSSFDVIWVPEDRQFLFCIAERGGVQRRTLVCIEASDALGVARFLQDKVSHRRPTPFPPSESDEFVEEDTALERPAPQVDKPPKDE